MVIFYLKEIVHLVIDLTKQLIGPSLSFIREKLNRNWLHKYIKNNLLLRKEKDKDAISIYEKYK